MTDVDVDCPEVLAAARRGGGRPGAYVAPGRLERVGVQQVLTLLLTLGERALHAAGVAAQNLGFELVAVPEWPGVVALREQPSRRQGGGAYLVRCASRSALVVQAPHTFTDEGTLPLACGLFRRARARALFIDTVHRLKGAPLVDGARASDVAHNPRSTFHAATVGLVHSIRDLAVIQLHGFRTRGSRLQVVLSTGRRAPPSPYLDAAAAGLTAVLGPGIARFPEDTGVLGATRNVQGRRIRAAGGRFLHVELVRALRDTLLEDAALRGAVYDALRSAMRGEGPAP